MRMNLSKRAGVLVLGLFVLLPVLALAALTAVPSGPPGPAGEGAPLPASALFEEGDPEGAGESDTAWEHTGAEVSPVPWVRLIAGTLIVAGLICVGAYLLKRFNVPLGANRKGYLSVLEARQVGRSTRLLLVSIGPRVMLIACTGENATTLAEMSRDDLPEVDTAPRNSVGQGFRSIFGNLSGNRSEM